MSGNLFALLLRAGDAPFTDEALFAFSTFAEDETIGAFAGDAIVGALAGDATAGALAGDAIADADAAWPSLASA